jgi:hypothetical protein
MSTIPPISTQTKRTIKQTLKTSRRECLLESSFVLFEQQVINITLRYQTTKTVSEYQ